MLRKTLWVKGYRYRKNYSKLPGKPDIALTKYKIAIFCDSEFFHGKDWDILRTRLETGSNGDYWINKIVRNMERDEEANRKLRNMGWRILRFWGKYIKKDAESCINVIEEMIFEVKMEDTEFYD